MGSENPHQDPAYLNDGDLDNRRFDLCDARRHFAIVVPQRAITCPTLLNAVFALSSRHLSPHDQYDPYASDRYHQECLKQLSAISNDSSSLEYDDLLAATILLRTLEEFDVPLIGTDHEGHLLGIPLFMNTQNASSTPPSPFRQASFWVGLRQETAMAFATQRADQGQAGPPLHRPLLFAGRR